MDLLSYNLVGTLFSIVVVIPRRGPVNVVHGRRGSFESEDGGRNTERMAHIGQ